MSAQAVETVLIGPASDEAFANLLSANPEQVLSRYDRMAQEIADFKAIGRAGLQKCASASLGDGKSKGISLDLNVSPPQRSTSRFVAVSSSGRTWRRRRVL